MSLGHIYWPAAQVCVCVCGLCVCESQCQGGARGTLFDGKHLCGHPVSAECDPKPQSTGPSFILLSSLQSPLIFAGQKPNMRSTPMRSGSLKSKLETLALRRQSSKRAGVSHLRLKMQPRLKSLASNHSQIDPCVKQ